VGEKLQKDKFIKNYDYYKNENMQRGALSAWMCWGNCVM